MSQVIDTLTAQAKNMYRIKHICKIALPVLKTSTQPTAKYVHSDRL